MPRRPTRPTPVAFVALGGNVGDVLATFRSALDDVRARGWSVEGIAPAYRTAPLLPEGGAPQADYWNSVVALRAPVGPRELLEGLLEIERRHGRARSGRWEPRTLDLDLLMYGDERIDEPGLRVPHPALSLRLFVLRPLFDLAPDAVVPTGEGGERVRALLEAHPDRGRASSSAES